MSLPRRDFLQWTLQGALCAAFAPWGAARGAPAPAPKARACILLWMNGGPSQMDTWDLKPGAPGAGRFKPIATRVPGLSICEHLPLLAERAQHLAVLRGMTSSEGNHQRAHYFVHTGYAPNPTLQHPSLGAYVSQELGAANPELPNFISIKGASVGAGFLGVQNGPFIIQDPKRPPLNVTLPKMVDDTRFLRRRALLDALEGDFAARTRDDKISAKHKVRDQSIRLMQSPQLPAFDLSLEPATTLAAYGDSDFAKGCLLARRLVEAGVRFVEVVLDGWDTHVDNFGRTQALMATLDPALSALLDDLAARELLDSTLVLCMGEFGRTPALNGNEGRDHFPQAWSAVLAGGGIRGGQCLGATAPDGSRVVERPTKVQDVLATAATLVGMDPAKTFDTPVGRPISLTDGGKPIAELLA